MPKGTEIVEIDLEKEKRTVLDEVFPERYRGYTLIEAFPGVGLVGTISANHLATTLNMKQIGYIKSDKFPAVTSIHNYLPLHPARVYKSDEHRIILIFSEFIIPISAVYELAEEILNWGMQKQVAQFISLGGIGMKEEKDTRTLYAIASTPVIKKFLEKHKIQVIKEGATTGVSGVLLAKCAIRNIPAYSLLVEALPDNVDPAAAAIILQKLQDLVDIKIDTRELTEEAHRIQAEVKQTLAGAKQAHEEYQRNDEAMGLMYG